MEPLSRSSQLPLDPTDDAEIVSVMKGRRGADQYTSAASDDLEWGEHGIGRVHRTHGPDNRPHIKGRYEEL